MEEKRKRIYPERLTEKSLDGVAELEKLCFSQPWSKNSLGLLLKEGIGVGMVCSSDGQVCAYGGMMVAVDEGQITNIATHPDYRRQGYGRAVGIDGYDTSLVEESAALLMKGIVDFEFRTTLVRELHTEKEIIGIGEWIRGGERYFLQTFKDSGDLLSEGFSGYDENETRDLLNLLVPYLPNAKIRG